MIRPDETTQRASPPLALAAELGELAGSRPLAIIADFDGTLSPLVAAPEEAVLVPESRAALGALAARSAVLIVSGRTLDDLRARVALSGVALAGEHGGDIELATGEQSLTELSPATEAALDGFHDRGVALLEGTPGHVERKRLATAAHTRRIPPDRRRVEVERSLAAAAIGLARPGVAEAIVGARVIELRAAGASKDRAFARFARTVAPGTLFVALGDDASDEDTFAAVASRGGFTIRVSEGWSAARHRLESPASVAVFLTALAGRSAALRGGGL